VKPDLDELRTHVAGLSDEALLEVQPDELVESARTVYEAEMASRGISWNLPQDAPSGEAAEAPAAMVSLARFESVEEARFARTMLENEGVPVWFAGELTPQRITADASAALELITKPEYLEQAQEILSAQISDEELARQAEEAGPSEEELLDEEEAQEDSSEEKHED
jgi:hypothetical protein